MPEVHTVGYVWRPAKPHVYTCGRERPIESVILHSTCGREAGDLAVLTGETEVKVSVHWYVNRSGKVYHLVQDSDTAWHAGRTKVACMGNAASVGIEMEHFDPDDAHPSGEDWPARQVEEVSRLCAFLLKRHHLEPDDIHSHEEAAYPPGRKSDPVAFPWQRFRDLLATKLQHDWRVEEIHDA